MRIRRIGASASAPRRRRSLVSFLATLAVVASSALGITVTAAPANAASAGDSINYTLEGCRNNGTITLPNGSGNFICPTSAYTTGNLGKGWNELDLVPMRVTLKAGNSAPATQNFAFALAVDNCSTGDGATGCTTGRPGYDVLSSDSGGTPVLNTGLSSGTCGTLSASAQQYAAPGIGGAGTTLYRVLTVTGQAQNSTCVYDAFARLALGSHLYPGASLHFNLANDTLGTSGVGSKEVSIPVNEISPQELAKDMSATQGSDHVWDIVKSPTPATVSFADTCTGASSFSKPATVTVTWTKQAATPSGPITVITHVYATNPAARVITINATDNIRSGTTVLDTVSSGAKDVPANTANFLVLTHTTLVPAGTTNLNDIATATYTDKVTGIPVPGSTQATASATVQLSGPELNQNAVITDVESISGAGLSFSVDSFSGASGSFDNSYVAGTPTTGSVSWTSAVQTGSGSVTFNKTIYSTSAIVTSGTLSDTAVLTGSDGFTTQAQATINISTQATGRVTVSKTTSLSIAQALAFTFHLLKGGVATGDIATVNLPANSQGPVSSNTISGLDVTGSYSFHEDATAPYGAQNTAAKTFSLVAGNPSTCALSFPVENNAPAASARVKKDTNPASSGNWTMTLTGPNGLSETLTDVAAGSGYNAFASLLNVDGGTYTITETQQAGYDLTGLTGDFGGVAARVTTNTSARTCSFTLDLTTDSGKIFSCAYVNTKRGTIIVKKVTNPAGAAGSFAFSGDASGSIGDGGSIVVSNLVPGTYTSTEAVPAGWDLTNVACDDGQSPTASSGSVATATATFKLDPGETVTCTFTNTQRGHIIVKKVTDPAGSAQSFEFDPSYSGTNFFLKDGQSNDSGPLVPGTYSVAELTPTGWDLTGKSCDDGSPVDNIALAAGETVTCTFTNTQRGKIIVVKQTDPDGSTQKFEFDPSYGANFELSDGQSNDSGFLQPGTYSVAEVNIPSGWDPTGATCSDGSDPSKIDLASGEVVTCTFTNRQRGTIIVKKITNPTTATDQFTYTGDAAGTIGNGGTIVKSNLVAGTYTSTETVPVGWDLNSVVCNDGQSPTVSSGSVGTATATFKLDPGETVTCTFTNKQRGKIIVKKVTQPAGSSQSFEFDPSYSGTNFFLKDGESNDSGFLLAGTYSVAEVNIPALWDLISKSCDDGSLVSAISLQPGETVTCTFTNRLRGSAKVIKTVANHDGSNPQPPTGTEAFTFQLRQGATNIIGNPGTILETKVANAANAGQFTFATSLTPGDHYQVCELLPDTGWEIVLGAGQFVPEQFLQDGQTLNPGVINNVYCLDFVAQTGPDPTVFNVLDKRPPGGFGLTIGYWKNWASCTKSSLKSKNSLDITLFKYGTAGLIVSATSGGWPTFGPTIYLALKTGSGSETSAQDCAKAVNLLNKSTSDGKKKMASDPAFNLVAQLIAAQLNYKAGAATTVTNQINQAVLLLGKYQFNGLTHTAISAADAAAMNSLATTLDKYNNNLL